MKEIIVLSVVSLFLSFCRPRSNAGQSVGKIINGNERLSGQEFHPNAFADTVYFSGPGNVRRQLIQRYPKD